MSLAVHSEDPVALIVAQWLAGSGLEWEEAPPGTFVVVLPGERKQRTTTSIVVGRHAVTVQAFVARHADENHEQLFRWLLERNRRTYVVSWCLDHLGDVYLSGRLSRHAVTLDELDRVLGSVLENADAGFNTILEIGFGSAIRKEWAWRISRGEPTSNLEAFRHLLPDRDSPGRALAPETVDADPAE